MQFSFLQKAELPQWNKFVESSPQGSVFCTSTYLQALDVTFKIAVLQKNNSIKAGIVLARNEIGAYCNPLLVKYLGALVAPAEKNASYVNQCARERKFISIVADNVSKYQSFDYNFHPAFDDWLPFYWKGFRQEIRYTYRFPDIQNIEKLLINTHSRVRGDLRKAERNGIQFRVGIDVESFYRINSLSFQRQGSTPPYSKSKLLALYNGLKKENRIHLLGVEDSNKQLVAVAGIVNDSRCSYFLMNGIDHNKKNVGANTKLIIETIKYCSSFSSMFDFEGSMLEGIASYYQSFGAFQTSYHSIWKDTLPVKLKRRAIKAVKKFRYGQ